MCSLGPASSLIALVAFQSGGIERMVGLLVKLALRPNLTLLLARQGSRSSWLPFMRVFVVVLSSSLLFVPRP